MSRETLEALAGRLDTSRGRGADPEGDQTALAARLAHLEQAYGELLDRVRRYERERAEIRDRLKRILAWLGPAGAS